MWRLLVYQILAATDGGNILFPLAVYLIFSQQLQYITETNFFNSNKNIFLS